MKHASAAIFLSSAIAASAAAQEAPDTIRVEALPRTPGEAAYGAVVIDRDRLQSEASGRLENVLGDIAGFRQFRRSDSRSANPTAQGANLRSLGGNATSRTLILLDGVPQTDPFFGYVPFNALAPERLASVRVTRGGGAGAFGAGAVAGVVELDSAGRETMPLVNAQALYGSRDSAILSGALSPEIGDAFASLSARLDRSDGFWTAPEDQFTPASVPARYESWSSELRGEAPLGNDVALQWRGAVFRDDRTLRFDGADSSIRGEDGSLRLLFGGPWRAEALVYLQKRNFTNVVISSSSFQKVLDQRDTPSTGYGGKIEVRPPVGERHVLRVGVDARVADGEMFEDAYSAMTGKVTAQRNAGGKTLVAGVFMENDWTLGQLVLTAGARADHWSVTNGFFIERNAAGAILTHETFEDRDGWRVSARGGAQFEWSPAITLRGAAYTGFRMPTLNEYYRPFVVFPVRTEANAGLDPERLIGVEGGATFYPAPGLSIAATAFYNRLEDAIANVTIGANLRQRRNVDAIVAGGVELDADWEIAPFAFAASYAFSHSTVRDSGAASDLDGMTPSQSPRHAASVTGGLQFEQASFSVTARYIGEQYEDDLETEILPSVWTIDASARLGVAPGVDLLARGENLLDEEIVTRRSGDTVDLGTPRTMWIGVEVRI